ncbi:MAG: hypothetical protein GVY36_17210 [Verrucomicrobia bacterium]|jgi:hypothetical protein|nr:hypothetical protein [Verrucomicrobiota bacterium]
MPSSTSSFDGEVSGIGGASSAESDVPRETEVRVHRSFGKILLFVVFFLALDLVSFGVLLGGLERYYGLESSADVLVVGHSHTVLAVDKLALQEATGFGIAKYARQGATVQDRAVMVRHYLSRHPGTVKAVVFGVDAHMFSSDGLSRNSYQLFLPFMNDAVISEYLKEFPISRLDLFVRQIVRTARFSEPTAGLALRGILGDWSSYKSGVVDLERLRKQLELGKYRGVEFNEAAIDSFETMVKEVVSEGIFLVLTYFPTIDLLNEINATGVSEATGRLQMYATGSDRVVFLDYNTPYQSRHDFFFDPIHLNTDGQRLITAKLGGDLNRLLQGGRP